MDSRMELADVVANLSEDCSWFPSYGGVRKYPRETQRGVVQGAQKETLPSIGSLADIASSSRLLEATHVSEEHDTVTEEVKYSSSTTTRQLKTPVITSRRAEKREKWASIKEEVYQLYVVESKTLQDTISEMEKRHSFKASLRKWKMQVKEWSFDKNVNRRDMATLLAKSEKRARDEGKDTVFNSRYQKFSPEKLVQFKKRKLEDAVVCPSAETPSYITYQTPRWNCDLEGNPHRHGQSASTGIAGNNKTQMLLLPPDVTKFEQPIEGKALIGNLDSVFSLS